MNQRKLRIGIAGMGYVGRIHYEAARKISEVEVVAVASRRISASDEAFSGVAVVPSTDALFERSDLDAVLVCVPTFLHEAIVIEAVGRGLHVLCEKPMALDVASAERMLQAAEKRGVVFMVAQLLRFWPQYTAIKRLAEEGTLGRIYSIAAYRLATLPAWSEWFSDPQKSGGSMLDLQVHDMDFIYWLLGRAKTVQSFPVSSAESGKDHVNTVLTFADEQTATIEASYLPPRSWPFSCGLRAIGSQATAEYRFVSAEDIAGRAKSNESGHLYRESGEVSQFDANPHDMFVAQLRHFTDCVLDRHKQLICPPQQSFEVMRLLDASKVSAAKGTPVLFEP